MSEVFAVFVIVFHAEHISFYVLTLMGIVYC